ncbi:MAG: hypothetical protein Salg2KO_17690 [Salibacteraceae bacterium]
MNIYALLCKVKRIVFFGCILLALAHYRALGQDIGVEAPKQQDKVKNDSVFTDPYKLTLRIRPLSYLLVIPTAGFMGSFNIRSDYAINRHISLSAEVNWFYLQPNTFTGVISTDRFSLRLDGNYFFMNKSNMSRYAEGFHVGPYIKLVYDNTFDPFVNLDLFGTSQVSTLSLTFGPMIGFQHVTDRLVIDQSFGFGAGLGINDVGFITIVPDVRMGLSIGTVLF